MPLTCKIQVTRGRFLSSSDPPPLSFLHLFIFGMLIYHHNVSMLQLLVYYHHHQATLLANSTIRPSLRKEIEIGLNIFIRLPNSLKLITGSRY